MLLLAATIGSAIACPFPDTPAKLAFKRDLPGAALAALGTRLAERGTAFNWSDVIEPRLPSARFVSAEAQGCRLTLVYEAGGVAGPHRYTARLQFFDGRWTVSQREQSW